MCNLSVREFQGLKIESGIEEVIVLEKYKG